MSTVRNLLGLLAVGRTVIATTPLFVKLATSIAVILFVSMFILLMGVAMILTGLYNVYLYLGTLGVDPIIAKLLVFLLVLLFMLGAVMIIQLYVKRIRTNVIALMFAKAPLTGRANYVLESFLRGFRQPVVPK